MTKKTNVIELSRRARIREMDDAVLEFWSDVYLAAGGHDAFGVPFERFLESPHAFLSQSEADALLPNAEFLPLLPEQERVIARLEGRENENRSDFGRFSERRRLMAGR